MLCIALPSIMKLFESFLFLIWRHAMAIVLDGTELNLGFDLANKAIDKKKENGMWQMAFKGQCELKIVPSQGKKFTTTARSTWKKQMQARGAETMNDLPEPIQESVANSLLHELVCGWKALVKTEALNADALKDVKPLATTVYESTGDPTPEGFSLIPYMIHKGNLYEYSVENAKLLLKESEDLGAEVSLLSRNKELYTVGGLTDSD